MDIEPATAFRRVTATTATAYGAKSCKHGKLSNLVGEPALIVAGFALLPTPGPNLIIVIGIWMLAGEFLPLARFLIGSR